MTYGELLKIFIREERAQMDGDGVKCPICSQRIYYHPTDFGSTVVYVKSKLDKKHRFYHKKCVENQWKSGEHQ